MDVGGRRLGNLMRSFRESVESLCATMGSAGAGTDSTLTNSGVLSSPSLSSSMTSVCGDNGVCCGWRRMSVFVRTGEGRASALGVYVGAGACGVEGVGAAAGGSG